MHVLVGDDLHGAQEDGAVGFRPQRHPVVRPIGGRIILRRDHDDARPALDGFQLPVRFRHLVLDEVLPPAGVQLGEAHVREVDVRALGPRPPGMGRVLVPVPGVVRPIPAALRLLRAHFANPGVQQGVDAAVDPGVAHLADDAQHGHAGPMLEAARARALHHLDHFRGIALLPQAPGARFAAIPGGDDDHRLGGIGEGRIPRHAQHVVQKAAVEFVLALGLGRQLRGAVVHPLLPPLAHQRPLQAIRAVHPAVEGEPLQAHARVMRKGPAVAVEVFIGLVIVVLLHPHHDAVAHEGADAAGVRIVGRTTPRKRRIVPVLVVVDPLPAPIRVVAQRVAHLDDRLQRGQREDFIGHRHSGHRARGDF